MTIRMFLEQDLSRVKREKKRERIQERKVELVLRGGKDQRGKKRQINRESGVEECKEYSYERETDGIGCRGMTVMCVL